MADTKVQILRNGAPLAGVLVLLSDYSREWRETDEEGRLAFNLDLGTAIASLIAIKDEEGDILKYHIVLEEGTTVVITIPDIDF